MRALLARLPIDRAVTLAVMATVFLFACGSSSVDEVVGPGRKLRWVGLALLAAVAVLAALRRARPPRVPWAFVAAGAVLLGLALVSGAWSIERTLSLHRALSLALLFAAVAALAYAYGDDREAIRRLAGALAAGAVLVALAGVILAIVDVDQAIQRAYVRSPLRYRGFGFNPNTAAMLYAVAMPLSLGLAAAARDRRGRVLWGAALVVMLGSVIASGSRGALLATLVAAVVLGLVRMTTLRGRAIFVAATAVAFVASFFLGQIARPAPQQGARPNLQKKLRAERSNPPRYADAEILYFRLEDEIGRPPTGRTPLVPRTKFGLSGRGQAWIRTIEQAGERPLLGFGFGSETKVFVDRYYSFSGGTPEDSYISTLLELGAVGTALLLATIGLALFPATARVLRAPPADRAIGATVLAGAVGGVVIGLVQSYMTSVGNVATVSYWTSLALLAVFGASLVRRPV